MFDVLPSSDEIVIINIEFRDELGKPINSFTMLTCLLLLKCNFINFRNYISFSVKILCFLYWLNS